MVDFKEIIRLAELTGGLTLSPKWEIASLCDGYVVSDSSHNMNLRSLNDLTEGLLAHYIRLAKALHAFVGIYQRQDGTWDIDISHLIMDADEARAFGLANGQEAIWDAKRGQCIYLQSK